MLLWRAIENDKNIFVLFLVFLKIWRTVNYNFSQQNIFIDWQLLNCWHFFGLQNRQKGKDGRSEKRHCNNTSLGRTARQFVWHSSLHGIKYFVPESLGKYTIITKLILNQDSVAPSVIQVSGMAVFEDVLRTVDDWWSDRHSVSHPCLH